MCKFNMFITAVCVLFLIKLRWPKNKSILKLLYDYERAFRWNLRVWSGKNISCFWLKQEIIKIREWIPHIGPLTKVIPLKLFLDVVPSSFADITRVLRGCFRGESVYVSFYFVLKQTKASKCCGDVSFDILITSKRRFGSGYVLIHFETVMGI